VAITASALRQNVYKILDRVAETGVPEEIVRRGKMLRILAVEEKSKLANIRKRPIIKGDLEDLVHMDWSYLWRP
jgi:hypothetical protein